MSPRPCPLSDRELEVLRLVATGATNQQVARELAISPNTVKVHLRNIFEKLDVSSRTEATMLAVQEGWLPIEGASPTAPAAPVAPPPALPSVRPWQRVYLSFVVLVAVLAIVWPLVVGTGPGPALGPFSDRGRAGLGPAPWVDTPRWKLRAALPRPRDRLAVVAYMGRLYAIGGEGPGGVSGAVYVYDPASNSWAARAHKPTPVSNFGVAVINGKIYAVGGCTSGGGVSDALEVYDPANDVWSQLDPMPVPRCGHAVAALDDRLYVFGGWDGSRYTADVLIYDPGARTWRTGTPMPVARGFLGAVALDDLIYVVGGYDGDREYALAHRYDPVADLQGAPAWEELPSMLEPHGGVGATASGGALYIIGGGWRGNLEYNERFDPLSGTWSRVSSPLEMQWRNPGVAALGSMVYVVGGWSGDYLSITAAYQSSFRMFLPLGSRGAGP
ncbi:MAG: hypothetical protein J7M34_01960 [Anaerolineae bacterium]|nr:hypothetical protein [Anaerolineae bacterium]